MSIELIAQIIGGVLIVLTAFYFLLMLLYVTGWHLTKTILIPSSFKATQTFTVIVPARNEAANIEQCVHSIFKQSYPSHLFELIVINDHSEDETLQILKTLQQQYNNLTIINLQDYVENKHQLNSFKKLAINLAVQQSKFETIVTTDADCEVPQSWLLNFAYMFQEKQAKFVTAPVVFQNCTSWFQKFQSLDFMGMMCVTAASLYWKIAYMSNGANLAYLKSVYKNVKGFDGIDHIASGDDLLLMEKIVKKHPNNIFFLKSEHAIVKTKPAFTFNEFFNQRVRWASKSKQYQTLSIKITLLLVYLLNLLLIVSPLLIFMGVLSLKVLVVSLLIKMIGDFLFLSTISAFFDEMQLLKLFFPAQIWHILYIVTVGLWGNLGKYNWKGRKVR